MRSYARRNQARRLTRPLATLFQREREIITLSLGERDRESGTLSFRVSGNVAELAHSSFARGSKV